MDDRDPPVLERETAPSPQYAGAPHYFSLTPAREALFDGRTDAQELVEYARIRIAHVPRAQQNSALGEFLYSLLSQRVRAQLKLRLGDTDNGEAVATRLLEVYGTTKNKTQYRKALRNATQGSHESLRDFMNRLDDLAYHAYSSALERPIAVAEAFENGMRDLRVQEQFRLLRLAPEPEGDDPPDTRQLLRLAERIELNYQATQNQLPQVAALTSASENARRNEKQKNKQDSINFAEFHEHLKQIEDTVNTLAHATVGKQTTWAGPHRGGQRQPWAPGPMHQQTQQMSTQWRQMRCYACGQLGHIARWCPSVTQTVRSPHWSQEHNNNQFNQSEGSYPPPDTRRLPQGNHAQRLPPIREHDRVMDTRNSDRPATPCPGPSVARCAICDEPSCPGPSLHCPWCKGKLSKDQSQSVLHARDCPAFPFQKN